MNCLKLKTLLLLLTLITIGAKADDKTVYQDSGFQRLFKEYTILFYKNDQKSEEKLAVIRKELEDYHLKNNNLYGYFSIRLGEVFYDNDHKRSFDAIRKANRLFDEMKSRKVDYYFLVYEALGHIFQSRGSYRMAEKYYLDAYKTSSKADNFVRMRIFFRLANLHMIHHPEVARTWNNHCEELSREFPDYRQAYYVVEGIIDFSLNDADAFQDIYKKYTELRKKHPEIDDNGTYIMYIIYHAFKGQYNLSLERLDQPSSELNDIERLDLKRIIMERMNNYPEAIKVEIKRSALVDSLRTDMLFNNLNEINAEIDVAKMEAKAAQERQIWLIVALVLLSFIIAALIWRYYTRRRMQQQLIAQNKELEIALDHAKESDRMKDSFIKHVSHEIRTPLNIITGYAQIINNPDYDLTEEERSRMLSDISKNTQMISYIVNELLEVAEDESKQHYSKDDIIAVNEFCRRLIGQAEIKNKGRLSLEFISELDDDYTVHSNRRAIEKVLEQLLDNAMKFTDTGYVELKVHDSPDHGVVRFIVQDSGIGISEENQHRIFDRFFKEDVFKQGFGLGLTMSLKMAILLGGSLSLDREYKAGARFILTIPVKS